MVTRGELILSSTTGPQPQIFFRCVNALSWAHDGEILLSGGDDETYAISALIYDYDSACGARICSVRLWRMDQGVDDLEQEYPFVCSMNISTGHSSNIFAAHMLPFSSRM